MQTQLRWPLLFAALVLVGCNLFEDSDDYGPQPCEIYCNIMIDDCGAVFDDDYVACLDACERYPEVPVEDEDGNIIPYGDAVPNDDSLECRIYHAENVLETGSEVHCLHASPGGGGVCVDEEVMNICDDYCAAASTECPGLFESRVRCGVFCNSKPAGDPNDPAGDTIACRLDVLDGVMFEEDLCGEAGPESNICSDFIDL